MMRVTLLRHPRSACAGLSLARAHARANGLLLRRRHQRRLNHAVVTRAAAQIGREEEEERGRARQAGRQAGSPSPQSRSLSLSLGLSVGGTRYHASTHLHRSAVIYAEGEAEFC